jgi:ADP-heptose:LPS heptosyltransferase
LEARFIILHSDDPSEILLATTLIRCLKTQVEGALVYSVVKETYKWLLESNPYLDDIFVFQDNPKELVDILKDFLPDYLIDLDGGREVRRFKNRLKVLDFTINRRNPVDQWTERAFGTCALFDVQDDGKGQQFVPVNKGLDMLPSEFLKGFIVLSLDHNAKERPISDDQIIELVVMTEKPIVVTGNSFNRDLANRISQSTGCAVFPTCGDITDSQIASIIGSSKGVVVFDSLWYNLADTIGVKKLIITGKIDLEKLKSTALWARSLFDTNDAGNSI